MSLLISVSVTVPAFGEMSGVAAGYGLGNMNPHEHFGKIRRNRGYEFFYLSYFHGFQLIPDLYLVLEPFTAVSYRSRVGVDLGLGLLLRYNLWNSQSAKNSFFVNLGTGGVLTTVSFTDQPNHALFILQGGVGFKWDKYFIELRHRHYSNAGTARPNKGVETEVLTVGFHF